MFKQNDRKCCTIEFKLKRIKVDNHNIVLRHSFICGFRKWQPYSIKKLPSLWDCLPKYSEVPLFGAPEKVAETNSFDSHLNA